MNTLCHESCPPAEALMREVLRDGRAFEDEYPLVFAPGAPGRVLTVEDPDGLVLSACATLERRLLGPLGARRAGLIGSVVTRPERRGEGHGAQILAAAEARFAASGCLLALLWADDPAFYTRRGYVPVGAELDWPLERRSVAALPEPRGVRPASERDCGRIHELYQAHLARVDRSLEETRALLRVPGLETLVLERDGQVVAYAARGRGEDLGNAVHEWGGGTLDVLALARAHVEASAGELVVLMASPTARELARYLEIVGIPGRIGYLGMGKLVSLERAAALIAGAAEGEAAECSVRDGRVHLRGPRGSALLDATQALLCIVPPRGDGAVIEAVEAETGLALRALPWAPFVWGLDSI